jgi:hypothetical protein
MKIEPFLEKQAEKIPGLGYVATALSLVAAIALSTSSEHFQVRLIALVWLCAVFFYFLGGALDPVFYDPWFSLYPTDPGPPKRFWYDLMRRFPIYCKDLAVARRKAALKLKQAALEAAKADELAKAVNDLTVPSGNNTNAKRGEWTKEAENRAENEQSGIYQTAKALFQKSDSWEIHVKPWLELSKAARAFVIPFFLIGLFDIVKSICPHMAMSHIATSPLKWFTNPLLALGLSFVSLVVYLWWRVVHATHLFELVSEHDVFTFNSQSTEGRDGAVTRKRTLISTGSAVFRWDKLPLVGKDDR